jgi:hypothetical protein
MKNGSGVKSGICQSGLQALGHEGNSLKPASDGSSPRSRRYFKRYKCGPSPTHSKDVSKILDVERLADDSKNDCHSILVGWYC